ncbi:MAG: ABC transporter ATP-binding protein [Candidatus Dormibacteraeota bacterium]|nr:ABC transporter ATP-binding protein [Candidatus Dormibacteraeota bacterium]
MLHREARSSRSAAHLVVSDLQVTLARQQGAGQVTVVDDLSLQIDEGEIVGMVGESGSGKTMTALSVLRLLPKRARLQGSIRLAGQELTDMSESDLQQVRGAQVGMIFQEATAALNPVFTVGAQLRAAIRAHGGVSRRAARERSVELLRMVGLPEPEVRVKQHPHQLSGGMNQRVMIAMALASGARLLIADEPTTSLDVTIQDEIIRLIERLVEETRIAVLFISHDLGLVSRLCHRVAVMYAGQIVETGPTRQIMQAPMHPYTRGLLRCVPDLHEVGAVRRGIPGNPPLPGTLGAGCRFRDRCEFAMATCQEAQVLEPIEPEHLVRCGRAPELPAVSFVPKEGAVS